MQASSRDLVTRLGLDERLALWLVLNLAGFAWVNVVECGRSGPFLSRHGGYDQFARLLALSMVFYFIGLRHTLKPFRTFGAPALTWNLCGFALPFFAGLQFFYLQRIKSINYSLNYHDLSRMGATGIVVFGSAAVLIIAIAAMHLHYARREHILVPYAASFLAAILFIAAATVVMRHTHYLHIHHWFLFAFFIPFARFRTPVSVVCQALCAGIYVEGVAEWGMASIWELRR